MDGEVTLQERLEALKKLNRNRFDYVLARSRLPSRDAALAEIGLTKGWFYKFPKEEQAYLERLSDELHYEQALQAHMILISAAPEAARVKVEGLKNKDARIKQASATEILDRTTGKPLQRTQSEVTGKDGGDLVINVRVIDAED